VDGRAARHIPRDLSRRKLGHDGKHDQGGQEQQALDQLAASR
jgi:hypothetical protein